jgi:antitoxin VapB
MLETWYILSVDTTLKGGASMTDSTAPEKEVRAKLFVNGRSQAVRLPKEFRFEGKEVRVRHALGGVLLEPVEEKNAPWKTLTELYARFSPEEADPIFPGGREQPEMQERDWSAFE